MIYSRINICQLKQFSSTAKGDHESVKSFFKFFKTGKDHITEGYISTKKTEELLQQHLKCTGGQIRTRFAPEPNGQLHLGHAKALSLNFGYAKHNNGICLLRYDDTNPSKCDADSCKSIKDSLNWLGYEPYQVTYTSDYFDVLYQKALELINKNLAYVCHELPRGKFNAAAIAIPPSKWRDRPMEQSLQEFENMQKGTYKKAEACLRLKHHTADNISDPIAYRIMDESHFRTGSKWRVYPTYDFSHCLADSLQNITHSLCSAEFYQKRSTYYWVCNALDMYCPVQVEFGRLNILNTITSKRKLISLIEAGIISGWDDIRLYTLTALKRKGVTPGSINEFIEQFGFELEAKYIEANLLDCIVRRHLLDTAKKFMCVLKPIKVEIINFPYEEPVKVKVPFYTDKSKGTYEIAFGKDIWIDGDDFQEEPSKTFWRLTKGQAVGLKYSHHVISLEEVVKNVDGSINTLKVTCRLLKDGKKPKTYIHWVYDPLPCQVNLPDSLLSTERPSQEKLLDEVNMDSLLTISALINRNIKTCNPGDVVQFERVGYFVFDISTSDDNLVFNKTCDLKQRFGFKQSPKIT